jgi:hypothetical protein
VLVFAHHRPVLDACCELAAKEKVGWVRIDGTTPQVRKTPSWPRSWANFSRS